VPVVLGAEAKRLGAGQRWPHRRRQRGAQRFAGLSRAGRTASITSTFAAHEVSENDRSEETSRAPKAWRRAKACAGRPEAAPRGGIAAAEMGLVVEN